MKINLCITSSLYCVTEEVMLAEENKNSGRSPLDGEFAHTLNTPTLHHTWIHDYYMLHNGHRENAPLFICVWKHVKTLFPVKFNHNPYCKSLCKLQVTIATTLMLVFTGSTSFRYVPRYVNMLAIQHVSLMSQFYIKKKFLIAAGIRPRCFTSHSTILFIT